MTTYNYRKASLWFDETEISNWYNDDYSLPDSPSTIARLKLNNQTFCYSQTLLTENTICRALIKDLTNPRYKHKNKPEAKATQFFDYYSNEQLQQIFNNETLAIHRYVAMDEHHQSHGTYVGFPIQQTPLLSRYMIEIGPKETSYQYQSKTQTIRRAASYRLLAKIATANHRHIIEHIIIEQPLQTLFENLFQQFKTMKTLTATIELMHKDIRSCYDFERIGASFRAKQWLFDNFDALSQASVLTEYDLFNFLVEHDFFASYLNCHLDDFLTQTKTINSLADNRQIRQIIDQEFEHDAYVLSISRVDSHRQLIIGTLAHYQAVASLEDYHENGGVTIQYNIEIPYQNDLEQAVLNYLNTLPTSSINTVDRDDRFIYVYQIADDTITVQKQYQSATNQNLYNRGFQINPVELVNALNSPFAQRWCAIPAIIQNYGDFVTMIDDLRSSTYEDWMALATTQPDRFFATCDAIVQRQSFFQKIRGKAIAAKGRNINIDTKNGNIRQFIRDAFKEERQRYNKNKSQKGESQKSTTRH